MLAKTSEKKKAMKLRSLGYSLNEISDLLKISKSSASLWLRDVHLSEQARKIISQKREQARLKSALTNHDRLLKRLDEAEKFANETVEMIRIDAKISRITCALLYWCEGEKAKSDKTLTFANSDPKLIATFLAMLRMGFEISESKFRVCLHLHDYHNEGKQIAFWSRVTGIPATQFSKTYNKPHTGKRTREGYAGCASIRYYDTRIARQVQATARAFLRKTGL
ncbi:MAG: hypothetical protein Q7S01_03700 [bacterium]|nr:hypothetical protein [bacterium]